jgi:3-methyl-2-oxobutanoate hydroxymethyltransferase
VRQYGDAAGLFRSAVEGYLHDVEQREFPSENESYHLPKETRAALDASSPLRRKA